MIYSTTLYKKFSHKAIPLSNRLGRFDRFTVLREKFGTLF